MNYINDILLIIILLLFPITIYLFYMAYNKNIGKEENKLMFMFSIFSSMYIILSKNIISYSMLAIFFANILIVIAYLKNTYKEGFFLSLFYIFSLTYYYNFNIYTLIITYSLYMILSIIKSKKKINNNKFILICNLILLLANIKGYNDYTKYVLFIITLLVNYFVVYIIDVGDSILKYHMSYKKLIEEKQIRDSLFKITHEIKNPLAVCKGYFDMLDINNDKQTKRYIPIIREEINHALLILNDFSNLSKIKIEKDIIDIGYLLEQTVANFNELAKRDKIKINLKTEDEIYVEADYTRLMQVFINLLKNSIEALENRENKKIDIILKNDNEYVYIFFEDNGCGMDKETLQKFDEPFYTTKKRGTGLGTTLSKEIIKAHEGDIKYESIYEKNTKVSIILPKIATS